MLAQTRRILKVIAFDDLTDDHIQERFKSGFEFGVVLHRLSVIDDAGLHKYRNEDDPGSVLANMALIGANVRVGLGVAVSQGILNDVITAQPGAAIKLLNLIVYRHQKQRLQAASKPPVASRDEDRRPDPFVMATLDAGIPITSDVLLLRRFYEAQKLSEFEHDEAIERQRLEVEDLVKRQHEMVLGRNYKERRRLQQEISSVLLRSVHEAMRQQERHQLMQELGIRHVRDQAHGRRQHAIAQLSRDEIAEFERILERELSVMDQSQDRALAYPPPCTVYANVVDYVEALAQALPQPAQALASTHSGAESAQTKDRSRHVSQNETLVRRRQAVELANQTDDDDNEDVVDKNPELTADDRTDMFGKEIEEKRAAKGRLREELLQQHRQFQEEFQRKVREAESEREPDYQQWMKALLDQIYWDKQIRIQKDYYRCHDLVMALVETAINASEYRNSTADGKVPRHMLKEWMNQHPDSGRSALPPSSNEADATTLASIGCESELTPSSASDTYLAGKPTFPLPMEELEKCRSTVAAGPQIPPPRVPETAVKFVIIGLNVDELLQDIHETFVLSVLDYTAYMDRLKAGTETGQDSDTDWLKSIQKALNHPKNPPNLVTLTDIANHLVALSPSFIVVNIPENVADAFVGSSQETVLIRFEGDISSTSSKVKSSVLEKEDTMQCHYIPKKEPGVIEYESAQRLVESWTNLTSKYRRDIGMALQSEQSASASLYLSFKSSLEAFLAKVNDTDIATALRSQQLDVGSLRFDGWQLSVMSGFHSYRIKINGTSSMNYSGRNRASIGGF